ncbi:hypothetical protein DEA98_00005, partial [Brucella pseudogrignonensis]|nr:hypothetical protein [Brucella pseudogrignonensis]
QPDAACRFDTSKMSGFARTMGEWLGKLELLKFTGLEKIWLGISALTKALAELCKLGSRQTGNARLGAHLP